MTVPGAQASMPGMKLYQDSETRQYSIRAYTDTSVTVNEDIYTRPLVVTPDKLLSDWSAPCFAELDSSHLRELKDLDMEILLLGTGNRQRFPDPRLLLTLQDRGVGIEVMTTPAACRTYNILTAEGRAVAAALFIEP
ncbi:Mth938-like domain-containing protein [Sulfuriflexus sp.]|uniref:Mth938-like domain-containing protein n=1 Tax=Sulfuriflexus sp. TaxID=2015443 RepID=UPI0028CF0B5E|nr:Mth938-like domain-containing protein [Sulfuriflexus sp.]MDT8402955.1 Mth938-like domain-containing protein [Sulfuriflexus sp.]